LTLSYEVYGKVDLLATENNVCPSAKEYKYQNKPYLFNEATGGMA